MFPFRVKNLHKEHRHEYIARCLGLAEQYFTPDCLLNLIGQSLYSTALSLFLDQPCEFQFIFTKLVELIEPNLFNKKIDKVNTVGCGTGACSQPSLTVFFEKFV